MQPEIPTKEQAADSERVGVLGILAGIIGLSMVNEVIRNNNWVL